MKSGSEYEPFTVTVGEAEEALGVRQVWGLQHAVDNHIRAALSAHDGNVTRAALALGIGRATLYRWLKDEGKQQMVRGQVSVRSRPRHQPARLVALREVREAWLDASPREDFGKWINDEIKLAQGRK